MIGLAKSNSIIRILLIASSEYWEGKVLHDLALARYLRRGFFESDKRPLSIARYKFVRRDLLSADGLERFI